MGPLTGIKVVEIAALGPVPFSGMMLTDLGAEVIRIDRAGGSDLGVPMDAKFDILGRGRRSIALDLTDAAATEVALKLVDAADIVIEGMRPGVMERLGLGPEVCLARNPRLVYGRMTGWGQTGPLAQTAGHDINYIALNGVLHAIGSHSGPPVPPINLVGDYGGGSMFLMVGLLAGLQQATATGNGQVIDASMLEGSSYLLTTIHMFHGANMWSDQRGSNLLDGGAPFYGVYETSDGKHMAVGAIEPKFYRELIDGLGLDIKTLPQPLKQKHWPELKSIFADTFQQKTRDQWTAIFDTREACVTPVLSTGEAIQHQHNRERNSFVTVDGAHRPNVAPRFSASEVNADAPVCGPGKHSREILLELGYPSQQVDQLVASGAVELAKT